MEKTLTRFSLTDMETSQFLDDFLSIDDDCEATSYMEGFLNGMSDDECIRFCDDCIRRMQTGLGMTQNLPYNSTYDGMLYNPYEL